MDDAIAAALDAVHARQERLARGDAVRPVTSVVAHEDTRQAPRAASPSPSHRARPRRRDAPPRRIVWISKPVQRWRSDGSVLEELGALEFLRGATLADVRSLVDQFYPFPQQRMYEFYHPTLRQAIGRSNEANVDPAEIEVLALVALAPPKPVVPVALPDARTQERVPKEPRSTAQPKTRSVEKDVREVSWPATTERQVLKEDELKKPRIAVEEIVVREQVLADGVVCDIVVREFDDATFALQVRVLKGECKGSFTRFKHLSVEDICRLKQGVVGASSSPLRHLYSLLCGVLKFAKKPVDGIEWTTDQNGTLNPALPLLPWAKFEFDQRVEPLQVSPASPVRVPALTLGADSHISRELEQAEVKRDVEPKGPVQRIPSRRRKPASHENLASQPMPPSINVPYHSKTSDHNAAKGKVQMAPAPDTVPVLPNREEDPLDAVERPIEGLSVIEEVAESTLSHRVREPIPSAAASPTTVQRTEPHSTELPLDTLPDHNKPFQQAKKLPSRRVEQTSLAHAQATVTDGGSERNDSTRQSVLVDSDVKSMVGIHVYKPLNLPKSDDIGVVVAELVHTANVESTFAPHAEQIPAAWNPLTTATTVSDQVQPTNMYEALPSPASSDQVGLDISFVELDKSPQVIPETEERCADKLPPEESYENSAIPSTIPDERITFPTPARSPKEPHPAVSGHGRAQEAALKYARTILDFLVELYDNATAAEETPDTLVYASHRARPDRGLRLEGAHKQSEALISLSQFQSAFLYYGIDHTVMALNGVLLAVEEELSAWSGDQSVNVEAAIVSHMLNTLGRVTTGKPSGEENVSELLRVEAVLNFVSDLLGWEQPTRIRMEVVETSTDVTFEKLADIAQRKGFRLSDNERSLLGRVIGGLSTGTSTELETWLADAFEVVYFLLYRSFAIGDKVKAVFIATREQRVRWVIQRMISLDPGTWRRLQLHCHNLDELSTWELLLDRISSFQMKRYNYSKLLDSDMFLRAFVTFVTNKSSQILQPFAASVASASQESARSMQQRFVVRMRGGLDGESWRAGASEAFLRDFGLKVCDLDSVNKERRARGLLSVNISGRFSAWTHHHTRLLGTTYGLHKKPRWSLPDMVPQTANNWFVFHADSGIVLEYVYVRHSLDLRLVEDRWEDVIAFIENEAKSAFGQFDGASGSSEKTHVLCGIGLNILQVGSLRAMPEMMDTPRATATTSSLVESISIGYQLSKNEDFAALRITFRFHLSASAISNVPDIITSPTDNAMKATDRFLCSANDDALQQFVRFGGIRFLTERLEENQEQAWKRLPYGLAFRSKIDASNMKVIYPRRDVLFFIRCLLLFIPRSEGAITDTNVALLGDLVGLKGCDGEDAVVDVATRALAALSGLECSDQTLQLKPEVHSLGEAQKTFLALRGLDRVRKAIDMMVPASIQRFRLEDALFTLLVSDTLLSQEALLVHAGLWEEYFVMPRVWLRSPEHLLLVQVVLEQVHSRFFVHGYSQRERVYCGCGCQGYSAGSFAAMGTVMKLFYSLLETASGFEWALQQMRGPLDLIEYLNWIQPTQLPSTLPEFSEAMGAVLVGMFSRTPLTHEACALACSMVTPRLWELVHGGGTDHMKLSAMQVIGLVVDRAIQLPLWSQFPGEAVECIVGLVSSIVGTSLGNSLSEVMSAVLLERVTRDVKCVPAQSVVDFICMENEQRACADGKTRSIFESILELLRHPPQANGVERLWRVPLFILLCTLMEDKRAAQALLSLGVAGCLVSVIKNDSPIEEVVASGRALAIVFFQVQWCSVEKTTTPPDYSSIIKPVLIALKEGAGRSFSRHQLRTHTNKTEEPLFGFDLADMTEVVSRYKTATTQLQNAGYTEESISAAMDHVWDDQLWREPMELLITHLKLLVVYSSDPRRILQPSIRDETAQAVRYLLRFIRDRTHVPELQVLLYLASTVNIVSALEHDTQTLGLATCLDGKLCERLFVYSRRSSALLSNLASRTLSVLLAAYDNRDLVFKMMRAPFEIVDEDLPTKQKPHVAAHGLELFVSNINTKLASKKSVEGDAAALACILGKDPKSSPLFFERYRFSTAVKYLTDLRLAFVTGVRTPSFVASKMLTFADYSLPVTAVEKDMIQLLRVAHSCLLVLARHQSASTGENKGATVDVYDSPYSRLDDEIIRTRKSIVWLLNDRHPLVIEAALRCVVVHLTHQPSKMADVLDPQVVDQVLSLGLDSFDYTSLQSQCLAAVRAILANPTSHDEPYKLIEKLFQSQERLLRCIKSNDFNVVKQAVELMVVLLGKNEDAGRRAAFAALFREVENQNALSRAFVLLCQESQHKEDAAGVLQRIVGFVLELELAAHIDSEILVEALTLTLLSHKQQLFLRPLVCKCLWNVATQPEKSVHFAKKSRLRAILSLLSESLTSGEAQHIAAILRIVAADHLGVRLYLSQSESCCLTGLAKILGSFSRISVAATIPTQLNGDDEDDEDDIPMKGKELKAQMNDDDDGERHVIRLAFDSYVVVSEFADEVYEEVLRLLVVLMTPIEFAEERHGCACSVKASGCQDCDPSDLFARAHAPRLVVRLLYARRIVVHMSDTNQRMMEAPSSEALTIVHLTLRVLQTLSRNHQCRLDILRGSGSHNEWWSIRWLADRCKPSVVDRTGALADASVNVLMTLSQLCAEPAVMTFVLKQREFLIWIFTHASPTRKDNDSVRHQRAATFMLARLAEHPKITRDILFQQKIGPVLNAMQQYDDQVVLANILTLARNTGSHCNSPTFTDTLVHTLQKETAQAEVDTSILRLVCDVLVTALLMEPKTSSSNSQLRSPDVQPPRRASQALSTSVAAVPSKAWSRVFATFADDDDLAGFCIRVTETEYVGSLLWPTDSPLERLLDFLLSHHLCEQGVAGNQRSNVSDDDIIPVPSDLSSVRIQQRTPSLQYVPNTAEQNAVSKQDTTFAGSERLWRFIQLLWRVCEKQHQGNFAKHLPLDFVLEQFGEWVKRSDIDGIVSNSTLARRQRLLSFVNELLRSHPDKCKHLDMRGILSVVEGFVAQSGSAHGAYELLHLMGKAVPRNREHLIEHIGRRLEHQHVPPSIRLLWWAGRPDYFERAVPLTRVVERTKASGLAMRVLEPFVSPASTAVAFSMALLDLASDREPDVLAQYVQSHSIFVLFDLLLLTLDTRDPNRRTQPTLDVSVLRLIRKSLVADPNLLRIFVADPRCLHAVVHHVFAVKIPTQTAAVRLLLELVLRDPTVAYRLRRLEDWATSGSQVQAWMVDAMEVQLARLHLTHLSRKEVVEVAHLVQVPVFASVKTPDLARLSVAFMESRLVERDHFVILSGVGHFSDLPQWMNRFDDRRIPDSSEKCSFNRTVEQMKARAIPVLVYKMQKEWYTGGSSIDARSTITKGIDNVRARLADEQGHPTWLVNRLARFLVEDRAEMLRRVSYRQAASHRDVASQLRARWTDAVGLLADLDMMKGVSRDSLACLVLAAGEATWQSLADLEQIRQEPLPLVLVLSEAVDYETEIVVVATNEALKVCGKLRRGDVFGFHPLSADTQRLVHARTETSVKQVLVLVLGDELIREQFEPSEYEKFMARLRHHTSTVPLSSEGLTRYLASLTARVDNVESSKKQVARRQLQLASLGLMEQLVRHSVEYAKAIINNPRVVDTIASVARSNLDPSLVSASIDTIAALTESIGSEDEAVVVEHLAMELARDSVERWRNVSKSFHLLLRAIHTSMNHKRFVYSTKLVVLVHAAFNRLLNEPLLRVDEVVDVMHALASAAPAELKSSPECCSLYVAIVCVLTKRGRMVNASTLAHMLDLVVFFDGDPECQKAAHDHILTDGTLDILRLLTANLSVVARSSKLADRTYLDTIAVYAGHISIRKRQGGNLESYASSLSMTTAVILDCFHYLQDANETVLGVLAALFEVAPLCATAAASSRVQVGNRVVRFYRHVFSLFRDLPCSRIGALAGNIQYVGHLAMCVGILSSIPRCAAHFMRHGFVEIAFRYLASWPLTDRVAEHTVVWISLLRALEGIVSASDVSSPPNLLVTYGTALRQFHSRLSAAVEHAAATRDLLEATFQLRQALAMCLDLIASIVDRFATSDENVVEESAWLVTEVAQECFCWIGMNSYVPASWKLQQYEDALHVASLRLLSLLCSSPGLMRLCLSLESLPNVLRRLCDYITDTATSASLVKTYVRYLCMFAEFVASTALPDVDHITTALTQHVLPSGLRLLNDTWVSSPSCEICPTQEYGLRLVWVIVSIASNQPDGALRIAQEISSVVTAIAVALSHSLSERALLNCVGCLVAVMELRLLEHQLASQLCVALADVLPQMFDSIQTTVQKPDDVCDTPNQYQFASRRWSNDTSLWPGFQLLIADVLQQMMSDEAMATAWLTKDPQLHQLHSFGLSFALHTLTKREPTTNGMIAVHTNCLMFIRSTVTVAARQLPPRIASNWRRAARKAGLFSTIVVALVGASSTPRLKVEGMKCLAALTKASVVDCVELGRLLDRTHANAFDALVGWSLSSDDGGDTSRIIDCLELIATTSCAVESVARLAHSAVRSAAALVCSPNACVSDRPDVLAALFRCYRTVGQHGPVEGDAMLSELVLQELDQQPNHDGNGVAYIIEGALLLQLLVTRSRSVPSEGPSVMLLRRLCVALKYVDDSTAREAILALCHQFIFSRHAPVNTEDTPWMEAVDALLEQSLLTGERLGVALCAQALARSRGRDMTLGRRLCTQLAAFDGLSTRLQLALMELLPALLEALERTQRLDWMVLTTWRTLRDRALAWRGDRDDRRCCAALVTLQCLVRVKQARALHEAVGAFRPACASWRDQFLSQSDGVKRGANEVALGIDVLVGVSIVLGLNAFNPDAVVTCAIDVWLESAVSTELGDDHTSSVALSVVVSLAIDDAGQASPHLVQEVLRQEFVSRLAGRMAFTLGQPSRTSGQEADTLARVALALLRTPTTRALLQSTAFDLVDCLSWALHRFSWHECGHVVGPFCDVVNSLCVDASVAARIAERRIVHRWVLEISYRNEALDNPRSQLDELVAMVFRHDVCQERSPTTLWKPLVLHTAMGIVLDRLDQDRFDSLRLELLADLLQQGDSMLQELWRVSLHASHAAQRTILRALTDPLAEADSPADRRHAAFVAYSLTSSLRRATPLIQARECSSEIDDGGPSMMELITKTLHLSVGTRLRHTIRANPHDWSAPASMFPLPLTFVASDTAVWTLRLLHRCLRDKLFARSLRNEWGLFDQVVVALACPNVDVSSAAAWALRGAALLQSTQKRLVEAHDELPERSYRTLAYFADLGAHDDIVVFTPPTPEAAALPSCFAIVELWIKYYARQIETLSSSSDARCHVEAVQEVALYLLTQYIAQIFSPDSAASRDRHMALCSALMQLACAPAAETMRRVRVLALELLTALGASVALQYSADEVDTLLALLEVADSGLERAATLRLLQQLTAANAVKRLFGATASSHLLQRLVTWLAEPSLARLRLFATAIVRQIVTRSSRARAKGDTSLSHKLALAQQQQTLLAIAEALFTDRFTVRDSVQSLLAPDPDRRALLHTATVVASVDERSTPLDSITVILHFSVLARNGASLREFRFRGKLRADRRSVAHEIVLEPDANVLTCDVIILSQPASERTAHALQLRLTTTDRFDSVVAARDGTSIALSASHARLSTDDHGGVLGRLLADPQVPPPVVADAIAIVAELAKSHEVFCAPDVRLACHIVAVMEAAERQTHRIDVAPLNALTTWFWANRSSVAHFRVSWDPLLRLVQRLRGSALVQAIAPGVGHTSSGPTFLLSLMEWLATLESESLTENCINVLFLENADVLLALAPHFYPDRSPRATFFFLVATVVRVNCLHCEVFARTHALQKLRAMLDDATPSSETLQRATRVVTKIARAGPATDKFLRHDGMELFGRLAFLVFGDASTLWDAARQTAADNLVLASAFLCEGIVVKEMSQDTRTRFTCTEQPHQLSLVETLLLYLADRHDEAEASAPPSVERLAARVLRAWIEHWPGETAKFEVLLASAVAATVGDSVEALAACYASGLSRCIELTRWDYFSELHTVRVSYSATLSAGVRTGVIPLVCRNAFTAFDKDVLDDVPRDDFPLADELDAVLALVTEHEMREKTLSANRKRALVSRVRVADSSARVAMAIHAVIAVVYDTIVDALAVVPVSPSSSMDTERAESIVRAWLVLLEQLAGLLCCGLDELDPVYYREVLGQVYGLLVRELPGFLRKRERVMRRDEAVRMVLTNFERLLKRLLGPHELRGVTSETEDVGQHAERFLLQYRQMKPLVTQALTLALSARDGMERLERGLVAAEYVWRRIVGDANDSITAFMAGTKEAESLWVKLRTTAAAIGVVLRHPGPLLRARWRRLQALVASLARMMDTPAPPVSNAVQDDDSEDDDDDLDERDAALAAALGVRPSQLLVSRVPFVSLESLLDHYGLASSGFKKQISLLNFPDLRPRVARAFARALGLQTTDVLALSPSELERSLAHFHAHGLCGAMTPSGPKTTPAITVSAFSRPNPKTNSPEPTATVSATTTPSPNATPSPPTDAELATRLCGLLADLGSLVDETDLGVHVRVIVSRTPPLSLWELLLAPVRRARLFSAYQRLTTWDQETPENSELLDAIVPFDAPPIVVKSVVHEPRASKRRVAVAVAVADEPRDHDPFATLATPPVRALIDATWTTSDPLSEASLVAAVQQRQQTPVTLWPLRSPPSLYRSPTPTALERRLTLVLLLVAFWRHEELEHDLTNAALGRAFATPEERRDFVLRRHAHKALDELSRVWMPESGWLGREMWHSRVYSVGGLLLCIAVACFAPLVLSSLVPTQRNSVLTIVTYTIVLGAFGAAGASMHEIAQKHFVVQPRRRLRLTPVATYYQNALALLALAVEVVQLNTISFDPQFDYSDTDQIPRAVEWLSTHGIAQLGVDGLELQAALIGVALVLWLVLLKCANKFQETNAVLNRVVTKDLPTLLHGSLYMAFLATFFSFLACVDCDDATASNIPSCGPRPHPPPFLLRHQHVTCWTPEHAPYALLGLFGSVFFLPIGLLAQGMAHVLFAHEALDVRFAPVVTLFAQLVKAVAAAARAFFPFHKTLLASVALGGNALLFALSVSRGGRASRWYLRHVKSAIYAASAWAAACALDRVQSHHATTTTRVYLGWLAIGGVTAVVLLRHHDPSADDADDDEELNDRFVMDAPSDVARAFVRAAATRDGRDRASRALLATAAALARDEPPQALRAFLQRAAKGPTTAADAALLQNARRLARQWDKIE